LFFSEQSLAALPALRMSTLQHLTAGALIFGAFFIATDPVTSPITRKGGLVFGMGVGLLTWIIRSFSSYPEGLMFAVLVMNGCVPLINRWTVPVPFGVKGAGQALSQDGDFGIKSS
jgi:electron transport complex protein RnfD